MLYIHSIQYFTYYIEILKYDFFNDTQLSNSHVVGSHFQAVEAFASQPTDLKLFPQDSEQHTTDFDPVTICKCMHRMIRDLPYT